MDAKERVLRACSFEKPDRLPRVDFFWDYPEAWEKRLGPIELLNDVTIWTPDEGTFPTRARVLKQAGGSIYEVDRWGRTIRRRPGAYFVETLEVAIRDSADLDRLQFDPPDLEIRYRNVINEMVEDVQVASPAADRATWERTLRRAKTIGCVFGKTGGPFLRSTYLRGEAQYLIDLAQDPGLAKAIADRVTGHLTAISLQEIERWSLQETGIWIFDDVAYNTGPLFGPATFERVFLPAYAHMIRAFKQAGARYVFFHSDGDIRLFLDMLIDAGIDGINPVEPRANMRIPELRKRYPKLILAGGMDNTGTLINGPVGKIEAETREIIDAGRDGGVLIGSGYIGPDTPLRHFAAYHTTCMTYGASEGLAEPGIWCD